MDIFKKQINKGAIVRAIPAPNTAKKPRSFYDSLNEWAKKEGARGLAYLSIIKNQDKLTGSGPIAKYFSDNGINKIAKICNLKDRDATIEQLLSLNHNEIAYWHNNLKQMPDTSFYYSGEHETLIAKLKTL